MHKRIKRVRPCYLLFPAKPIVIKCKNMVKGKASIGNPPDNQGVSDGMVAYSFSEYFETLSRTTDLIERITETAKKFPGHSNPINSKNIDPLVLDLDPAKTPSCVVGMVYCEAKYSQAVMAAEKIKKRIDPVPTQSSSSSHKM